MKKFLALIIPSLVVMSVAMEKPELEVAKGTGSIWEQNIQSKLEKLKGGYEKLDDTDAYFKKTVPVKLEQLKNTGYFSGVFEKLATDVPITVVKFCGWDNKLETLVQKMPLGVLFFGSDRHVTGESLLKLDTSSKVFEAKEQKTDKEPQAEPDVMVENVDRALKDLAPIVNSKLGTLYVDYGILALVNKIKDSVLSKLTDKDAFQKWQLAVYSAKRSNELLGESLLLRSLGIIEIQESKILAIEKEIWSDLVDKFNKIYQALRKTGRDS